jgi:sulfur relay (sulfurtransferase) DsrF/TusC family protein
MNVVALITLPPKLAAFNALNAVLAAAAFEHKVSVVFHGEGIQQLSEEPYAGTWQMAPDYDIEALYITDLASRRGEACLARGASLGITVISLPKMHYLISQADWIIT